MLLTFLYYKGRCLSVCGHSDVRLTSPPVLKLFGPKQYLFSKKYFMSFLPHYCHSFLITVIPSVLLSFLPYYCHSFRIIVIPSVLVSFLPNIVIPSELFRELQILTSSKSFPYPKGEKNGHRRWPYMRVSLKHKIN